MPGYWWQCEQCGSKTDFLSAANTTSICGFIRDVLYPADFDQTLLLRTCAQCAEHAVRITFEFPREEDPVELRVLHIIALPQAHLPMMWESCPVGDPKDRWFHFNYMKDRSAYGLNKASVWTAGELQEVFALYERKTGRKFPALP
jgi:hypothetical protein